MRILLWLFCVFFAGGVSIVWADLPNTEQITKEVHMSFKKPVYIAEIRIGGCPYELRVNDCVLFSSADGDMLMTKLPLNQWIGPGENTFTVIFKDVSGKQGEGEVKLFVREYDVSASTPDYDITPAMTINSMDQVTASGEVIKDIPFEVNVPYPLSRWMQGLAVELTDVDKQNIIKVIQRLWNACEKKDMKTIQEIMSLKNEELQKSRYQTHEERTQEMQGQYARLFEDKELKLAACDVSSLEYRIYGKGKLVAVVNAKTKESPVYFTDRDKTMISAISLFFFKDSDGEWKIIR